jgi:hypothetical protein
MKHLAIYKLYPQVVSIQGDVAYDVNENVVEYDQSLVNDEVARTQYQRQRAVAYPSIPDQLDTLFHGGYDAWKAQVQAVKDKYPKE